MDSETVVKREKETKQLEDSFFPECWKDDARMGVLLAEFRPRTVNPVSYDSKMRFWKELIASYCSTTGCSVVSIATLKECFRRKGTIPYCLSAVFDDMVTKGELVTVDQLYGQQQGASLSWGPWAVEKLMITPIKWGFEKARQTIAGPKHNDETCNFILKAIAKFHGEKIEHVISGQELYNRIINYDKLSRLVKQSSDIKEHGIQPALALLELNKRLVRETIVAGDHRIELFKFPRPNDAAGPITQIERSIYELEQTETQLINCISKIEHDIDETMNQVRAYIKGSRKQLAKAYLKKKHNLEGNLQRKINALENLQIMLSKIHDSQMDTNVIEAYKLGSNTLKQAFAVSGITLDSVDNTLAEMKDLLEQHEEVLNVIGTASNDDVDELELEQELSDLLDVKLTEGNINGNILVPSPSTSTSLQPVFPTGSVEDFDREIEKRLAALRVNTADVQSSVDGKIGKYV